VKKLITTFAFILASISTSAFSVELPKLNIGLPSLTVGVAGNAGLLTGTGKESLRNAGGTLSVQGVKTKQQDMFMAYGEVFAEIYVNPAVRIGISYVPYDLESETTERKHVGFQTCPDGTDSASCDGNNNASSSSNGQGTGETLTQKVQIDITDMTTGYISFHLPSGFFAKAGIMQADVITNEKLDTDSKYGNAQLNGYVIGVGYEHAIANQGIFVRGEVNQSEFEDIGLTATGSARTNNHITVDGLSGTMARISVGKNF
jgi:hypothetical protein